MIDPNARRGRDWFRPVVIGLLVLILSIQLGIGRTIKRWGADLVSEMRSIGGKEERPAPAPASAAGIDRLYYDDAVRAAADRIANQSKPWTPPASSPSR